MCEDQGMSNRTRNAAAAALLALGLIVTGCAGMAGPSTPVSTAEPEPLDASIFDDAIEKAETIIASEVEAERVAAEEAAAAKAEADRIAAEEAAAREAEQNTAPAPVKRQSAPEEAAPPPPAPAPAPPVLCSSIGAVPVASDGYNDTSCTWEVCYSISIPDPAHPECDANFRP